MPLCITKLILSFGRKRDRLLEVRVQPRPRSHSHGSQQLRPQSAGGSVSRAELLLPAPGGGSDQGEETGAASRRQVTPLFLSRNCNRLCFYYLIAAVFDGHGEEWGPAAQSKTSLRFDNLHQQSGSANAQTRWVTRNTCQINLKSLISCIFCCT